MSVATASAVLRVRLTRTISRALPRVTAAIAQAQPTLPVPIIPIFTGLSVASALHAAEGTGSVRYNAGRLEHKPGGALVWPGHESRGRDYSPFMPVRATTSPQSAKPALMRDAASAEVEATIQMSCLLKRSLNSGVS